MAKKTTPATTEAPADPTAPINIKVQGLIFQYTPRYVTGHVLTEDEASVMNQTFGENLRNNFAARMRAKAEEIEKAEGTARDFNEAEIEAFKADFFAYQSSYTFKAPRVGSGPLDPVEAEAKKIAKVLVTNALNAKNIKVSSLPEGKFDELVKGVMAKPEVRAEAQRRVEATKMASSDMLGELGL